MGGKSVKSLHDNRVARAKVAKMSMKRLMEEKAEQEKSPPTRDEHNCDNCGFKARYKFLRCPECEAVQK